MNKRLVASIAGVATVATSVGFFGQTFVVNAAAKEKLTTFTFWDADANASSETGFNDPIAKVLKAKTGVEIKLQYPIGDQDSKFGVMLASGDMPDLLYAKGNTGKAISAKKLINLEPLINKYGPNIKKLYGKYYKRLKLTDPNGKAIYLFPSYGVGKKNWYDPGQFFLKAGAIKENGYKKINTLADYETALKVYYKKHPKTADGQKTIPLSFCASDWGIYIALNDSATSSGGWPGDGNFMINTKTGKVKLTLTSQEHHDFYKWVNKLYNEGLVDPESFTQTLEQYKSKMATGRVVGTLGASWMFGDPQATLRGKKPEDAFCPLPIVQRAGLKNLALRPNGFVPSQYGIGITTSCKNPEKAVKFINYICSDEGQVLTHWGVQGKTYTIVKGKRTLTPAEIKMKRDDPDHNRKTGIGLYGYPFPEYGDGVKDPSGQYYTSVTPDSLADSYGSGEKDVLKHWGKSIFMDLWPAEETIPESKWGSAWQNSLAATDPAQIIWNNLDQLLKKWIPTMIVGKQSEYEKNWNAWQKAMIQAGVKKYEDRYTQIIQDTMKKLGE